MLESYAPRPDIAVGRLSAGFGGAFVLYGSLIVAVFALHQEVVKSESATNPVKISFLMPSPPPAPAPPLATAAASPSPTPSKPQPTAPIKPTLAPKDVPKTAPPENPTQQNTVLANPGDPIDLSGLEGEPPPSTGIPCESNCGKPGGKPGGTGDGEGLPDEGGAPPLGPGMTPPKKISEQCAPPKYPEQAKSADLNGTVKMRVTVNRSGAVEKAVVLEGPEIFQDSAVEYIKACHFTPAIFNDHPISVTKMEVVTFTLR